MTRTTAVTAADDVNADDILLPHQQKLERLIMDKGVSALDKWCGWM
jgi:hypothetical protein